MRVLLLLALCGLVGAGLTWADTLTGKGIKKLSGRVVSEGDEVVFNEFNSMVDGVEFGTHRVAKSKVKKIKRTHPAPHREFQRRLKAADTADACVELAAWCAKNKLKNERLWALTVALRLDADHAEARKLLGAKAPKGNWSEQIALARRYVLGDNAADRRTALAEIRRDKAFPFKMLYLQRAWRSKRQKLRYQEDRPVAMRADKLLENARYTINVPESYDPLTPAPLVIGLHGGGPGGADGKLVVGSGKDAMSFYRSRTESRGWICVCPTAVRAGWRGKNDDLIDAILDELRALYNIDENRIYLVGHSMGGGGTWAQGTRIPETWAAIAPAASYGVPGFGSLEKTKTGFYVYHSDDDPRTRVEGVRPRMESLRGNQKIDFVYTELPGRQHKFPSEVIDDIFLYFDVRLLARGPGRFKPQVRPLSSFLRKLSRDEKKYLPTLVTDDAADGEESLDALLKDLRTGGGVAENAVPRLVKHKDPKTAGKVAKIMLKSTSGADVRRYAARVLGDRKARDQLDALGRLLIVETESAALIEALQAIAAIDDAGAADDVVRFLRKRTDYLAGRVQGGRLHHSDWSVIAPTLAHACTLIGTYKTDKGAAAIASTVVKQVLLGDFGVVFDMQNQNPRPAGRALAKAACEALARLGGPDAKAALARLEKAIDGATDVTVERLSSMVGVMKCWPADPHIAATIKAANS